MDDPFAIGGLAVAGVTIVVYVIAAARGGADPPVIVYRTLALLFAVAGAAGGIKLGYLAVVTDTADLDPFKDEDRVFIFGGGLSLLGVSIVGAIETIKA